MTVTSPVCYGKYKWTTTFAAERGSYDAVIGTPLRVPYKLTVNQVRQLIQECKLSNSTHCGLLSISHGAFQG